MGFPALPKTVGRIQTVVSVVPFTFFSLNWLTLFKCKRSRNAFFDALLSFLFILKGVYRYKDSHIRSSLHNLEFYFIPYLSIKYFLLISFITHIIKAVCTVDEEADCVFHYFVYIQLFFLSFFWLPTSMGCSCFNDICNCVHGSVIHIQQPPVRITVCQTQFPTSFLIQIPAVCQNLNGLLVPFSDLV